MAVSNPPDAFEAEVQDPSSDIEPNLQLEDDLQNAQNHLNDILERSTHKRKHSQIYSVQSLSADLSGRFDDAEDQTTPCPHDSKRRRSHEHILQQSWLDDEVNQRPSDVAKTAQPDDENQNPTLSSRSSKFIEGSMNDRVSAKPPSPYLRTEEAMMYYHNEEDHAGGNTHQRNKGSTREHVSSNHRSSGIFRFGKAVVSAFNPVAAWGSLSEMWKSGQQTVNGQKVTKTEEQIKIEEAYAKLKKTGYTGTGTRSTIHVDRVHRAEGETVDIRNMPRPATYTTEKILDDEQETPRAEKRYGRVFAGNEVNEALQSGTGLDTRRRGRSASRNVSDRESSSKPSFHTRRPSLQNLHKVASYIQLPSAKRRRSASRDTSEVEPSGRPLSGEVAMLEVDGQKFVKKEDIRKHKKLSKQVSDLEVKLERARKELQAVQGGAPPVPPHGIAPDHGVDLRRKVFVPGALPSLPSERLLNQRLSEPQEADDSGFADKSTVVETGSSRLTESTAASSRTNATPKPATNTAHFHDDADSPGPTPPAKDSPMAATKFATSKETITKKRKIKPRFDDDKDSEYMPSGGATSTNDFEDDDELSASSRSSHGRTLRKPNKPSKLHEMSTADSPGSAKKRRRTEGKPSVYASADASRTKSTTDLPSKTLRSESSAPSRVGRPSTSSAKHSQNAPLSPKSRHRRRSISPYPYSSPERKRLSKNSGSEMDRPITVIPGTDTGGGNGEKIPPIPPIPKELKVTTGSENSIKGGRPAKGKIVVEEGGKTQQEKMHEKGKMSISGTQVENKEKFQWPSDVF